MHIEEALSVYSLHFDRAGSERGAIPLWDPVTDARLGTQPEWIRGHRSEPVAYVRGAVPSVEVTLLANHFVPEAFELSAYGDGCGGRVRWLGPHPVKLERKAGWTTLPEPVCFSRALPNQVGTHALELQWYAEWTDARGEARQLFLGDSRHEVFTTGAPLKDGLPGGPPVGTYAPLVRWSSRWCAGLESRKDVCDAILRGLPETQLRYGLPAWTVRHMLVAGGGMCGGWYQLFQQLANCQGVAVERRTLHLNPTRNEKTGEVRWNALVAVAPGINQVELSRHTRFLGRYHDCIRYPFAPDEPVELLSRQDARYCFEAGMNDGHSLNFLEDGGRLYLYDPSFLTEAIALDMALPEADGQLLTLGPESPFRRDYLHRVMPYVMGALRANGRHWEVDLLRGNYGITVKVEQVLELGVMWTG
ncbi:hypothetical protein [Pyxidicoccus xibeiensis]|uniref:hypothetical protein n=1 Tax=Pyxidicoccus xibeiensis TaxID=2906759 RepID=UPI0020A80756|nr:hypothetical protein [Pyxidicoccus xibeiensis]MCP3140873.1 hypothetical protein [Pyxidicoccus xibeiensis]